jgi:BA14K-like protein
MNLNLRLELTVSLSEFGPTLMKDMQAHAKKIRSDAAECLMLSNLVTEERRLLFTSIAEHLNSLALEIETETATSIADRPTTVHHPKADIVDHDAAPTDHLQRAPRWRRQFSLWAFVVLVAVASSLFWAMNHTELRSLASLPPKTDPAPRDLNNELAALLSDQTNERKDIRDRLTAVMTRLDGLVKELNDLKTLRAAIPASSIKATVGQDHSPADSGGKPQAPEESRPETSSTARSAAPEATTTALPATANAVNEAGDQVGTIAPARAELDPPKLAIGPAGCTHFRSFDPASGTYTTFDGRRRQCR